MNKGERTRKEIIDKAFILAGQHGLEGLSLGLLANETRLSKSGLFAHFKSKETLQLQVIQEVRERFIQLVFKPSLSVKRGEPRIRAFFEAYIHWIDNCRPGGGCIYMALCHEYDSRESPVRSYLVECQRDFFDTVERIVRTGIEEGHLAPDVDPALFTFELQGIAMSFSHFHKFLHDSKSLEKARKAFDGLLAKHRPSN